MDSQTKKNIEDILTPLKLSSFGFAELKKPLTIEAYKKWINKDFHGSMSFLKDHLAFKEFPKTLFNQARSAIVITKDYFPAPKPHKAPVQNLRLAEYAKNSDYHHWFQNELEQICQSLRLQFPHDLFIAMSDSKPVLERDLAQQAGLGWFGKNTCLIQSQQGSLFFIGEIYTSLTLTPIQALHPDRCGTCTKCIDACPTQALVEPYVLNANRCISYLTIEKRGDIPPEIMPQMNDWFFGCDICQTVCPWNEKVFGSNIKKEQTSYKEVTPQLINDLRWILNTSGKKLLKELKETPLTRTRASGLKRNALIVIANLKITELFSEVLMCKEQDSLKSTAQWCEAQLSGTCPNSSR